MATSGEALLRIGELSKRVGASPELLRAWERRYGLLRPQRSAGGLRLYSAADLERVARMQQHLAAGMAAAEAAALARRDADHQHPPASALDPAATRHQLAQALEGFDEPRAQALLDRLLAQATIETILSAIILPYLHELGQRWERGQATIAQEHFASNLLRGRLLGLARGWGLGLGPTAVLACLPGEQHDLGLIAFGLALRARGWRIVYLGPDAPLDTVANLSDQLKPTLTVLAAHTPQRVHPILPQLHTLAQHHRLALAGTATQDPTTHHPNILTLTHDPTTEAAHITTLLTPNPEG